MGPTWAPCWPHKPCYRGYHNSSIRHKYYFPVVVNLCQHNNHSEYKILTPHRPKWACGFTEEKWANTPLHASPHMDHYFSRPHLHIRYGMPYKIECLKGWFRLYIHPKLMLYHMKCKAWTYGDFQWNFKTWIGGWEIQQNSELLCPERAGRHRPPLPSSVRPLSTYYI